jgi:hypothetical protein
MWVTLLTVVIFCFGLTFLVARNQYFYLHSFFLIPLYPVIFFIDHNAHIVIHDLQSDSVHYVVKLLPLYLNAIYLLYRFRPRRNMRQELLPLVVNGFLTYNFLAAFVFAVQLNSLLPLFYASYSVPIFAVFYNARNFREELAEIRRNPGPDIILIKLYFLAFVFVYAATLVYSISAGITTTLLDSRGVGSVFASTSALVYLAVYAPLLVTISERKWPHIVTVIIGVMTLSKTILLFMPSYLIALVRHLRVRSRPVVLYGLGIIIVGVLALSYIPESIFQLWAVKFDTSEEFDDTLLSKFYLNRTNIFNDAVSAIKENPFGIGVGNFEHYSSTGYRDSHNFGINTVLESGWIFGLAFLGVFFVCFVRAISQIRGGSWEFQQFSFLTVFLIYMTASGVLLTTGSSDFIAIYYTPFYGVAIFQLISLLDRSGKR